MYNKECKILNRKNHNINKCKEKVINVLRRCIFFVIISLLFLVGCSTKNEDSTLRPTDDQPLELTKLSTQGITDQQPSIQAKQLLSQFPEVSQVRAINVGDDLFVAVNIRQQDRFSLDKIESDLRKKVIKQHSNKNVTLSTDQKFIIELEKLERKIDKKEMSKEKLQKKVDKLKKLSKEET